MIKYEVTYEVKPKKKGKKKTITRDFYDEAIAKAETLFVKDKEMGVGTVTATGYKKVKRNG